MITTITLNASIDKAYHMERAIENGTVMRVGAVRNTAGGKGMNVARIIRLCGENVLASGLAGGAITGVIWRSFWTRMGSAMILTTSRGRPEAASISWMSSLAQRNIWNPAAR